MSAPLSQLKILDLSTLLNGPYASMLMADMGADVLRIEAIGRDDLVKSFAPAIKFKQTDVKAHVREMSVAEPNQTSTTTVLETLSYSAQEINNLLNEGVIK